MNIIPSIFKSPLIGIATKHQLQFRPIFCTKCYSSTKHPKKSSSTADDGITNEPIKYSMTLASKWKAADSRRGHSKDTRPSIEPYVIIISISVFMLYFCVFREENDVDEDLGRSLYTRIDGLEELQLRSSLRYNEERGLPTDDLRKRLEDFEPQKVTIG